MRISEKQIWLLINVLRDTLTVDGDIFVFTREQRVGLYNDIINQQYGVVREYSTDVPEVSDEPE